MQQPNQKSRKWVDFSQESEEQSDSNNDKHHHHHHAKGHTNNESLSQKQSTAKQLDHSSNQFIEQQIRRLDDATNKQGQIWVLLESEDKQVLERKVRDFKDEENKNIISIYRNKEIEGSWDFKVKEDLIRIWIKEGIDPMRKIKITVSDRNFRRRGGDRDDKRDRGDRRGRGGRGGRGRGGRNRQGGDGRGDRNEIKQQKKKIYVDKVTGQVPTNKTEIEKQLLQEKSRHYTKQEAVRVGMELGNFRNKPKGEEKLEQINQLKEKQKGIKQVDTKKIEPKSFDAKPEYGRKPKEEVKMWSRKQREQIKVEQKDESKQINHQNENGQKKEKPSSNVKTKDDVQQPRLEGQKKKKYYARVDNLVETQKVFIKEAEVADKKEKGNLLQDN